jgi:hypothetical protein
MATRPRFQRRRSSATPDQPHRFEEIEDPGLSAAAAGLAGRPYSVQIASVVVTDNYIRKSHCAFCGRPREDPVHETDE